MPHAISSAIFQPGPDWAERLTAWSTFALAFGVGIAALQFCWQRRASKILETGRLLEKWDEENIVEFCNDLDQLDGVEKNRRVAIERYLRRGSKEDEDEFDNSLELIARMTERIEIYIRKGVTDESIIVEHIGYIRHVARAIAMIAKHPAVQRRAYPPASSPPCAPPLFIAAHLA